MLALSFGSFNSRLFMREALHTLLAWCVLVVVVLWMALCQEWSDMRWLRAQWAHQHHHKGAPTNGGFGTKAWFGSLFGVRSDDRPIPTGAITAQPLEDLFLDNLPYLTQSWISEALVNSAALISIVGGLLMIKGWQAKLVLLRRVAWMMAILYFIRSITISVTTLPPSVADCKPTVARNSREMLSAVLSMLSGKAGECTDKIFSGHTTTLFISFLFWSRYARHWSLIVYSALHTFLGIASVLLVRYHYTVDVVLAIVLTFFVHHVYYSSLNTAIRQRLWARSNRFGAAGKPVKAIAGTGVYNQVGSEDEEFDQETAATAELSASNNARALSLDISGTNPDAISVILDRQSEDEFSEKQERTTTASTLVNNSPQLCATRRSGLDLEKGFDDAGNDGYYFNQSIAYDYYFPEDNLDVLAVNRPMSKFFPALVAWMDGLHMRQ